MLHPGASLFFNTNMFSDSSRAVNLQRNQRARTSDDIALAVYL